MAALGIAIILALVFTFQVSVIAVPVWLISWLIGYPLSLGPTLGIAIGIAMLVNVLKS